MLQVWLLAAVFQPATKFLEEAAVIQPATKFLQEAAVFQPATKYWKEALFWRSAKHVACIIHAQRAEQASLSLIAFGSFLDISIFVNKAVAACIAGG
jgi:hypothetical protein